MTETTTFIPLILEFGGGMELLFNNQKRLEIQFPVESATTTKVTVQDLLIHMRDRVLTERPELFMQGDTIRPGVLILINESDWELEGGLTAHLNAGDQILFISTLHGG